MEIIRKSAHEGGRGREAGLEDLRPGMAVTPSLTLHEELGRGGFSRVFRAWHSIHRKFYAMKIFEPGSSVENAVHEYAALETMRHENIVRYEYSDMTTPEGLIYVLTELLDGENLRRYTSGDLWLPAEEVWKMAGQILSALTYMQGLEPPVFHRDVKPGNIVWHRHQIYKLIDFNIATATDDRSFGGTMSYIAPDLISDGRRIEWDRSADTFALGVSLYELLSHEYPWPGRDRVPNVHRYPTDIREFNGAVPDSAAEFLVKAVTTDREGRFRTAEEMGEALRRLDLGGVGLKGLTGGSLDGNGPEDLQSGLRGLRSFIPHNDVYVEPTYGIMAGTNGMSHQFGLIGQAMANGCKIGLDLEGSGIISVLGVPGSGTDRTTAALVEMALRQSSRVSLLPSPMAGVVFHYSDREDDTSGFASMVRPNDDIGQLATLRAEYGADPAALEDVMLLVPENQVERRRGKFPGIEVRPLLFGVEELNTRGWTFLLGAFGKDMDYVREMKRIMRANRGILSIGTVREAVKNNAALNDAQKDRALRKLDFAAEFIRESTEQREQDSVSECAGDADCGPDNGLNRESCRLQNVHRPGRLVIVDLRDDLNEREDVMGLFAALLSVFSRISGDKLMVFNEAHRYMGSAELSAPVSEVLREVRGRGATVVVESTDPACLPVGILELSSAVVLHRITSPAWLRHISKAVAPLQSLSAMEVAALGSGEAWLWAGKATSDAIVHRPVMISLRPCLTGFGTSD
ncbi:MAG: protein kinase [Bacteroidales bacterium]|nr:protein kinase [Bacteroidales bacterium]